MPTRHLLAVDNRYWHFRQQGDTSAETALVLLHASPRQSAMFAPLLDELALLRPKLRIIAPDTPGYGNTEPLPISPDSIQAYAPHFRAFFRELGLRQVSLYGTATGAQIAIAYANAYPDKVAHLLLDEACHFDDAERETRLARYFPNLSPQADGSHLTRLWQMANQAAQYFPWYMADEDHRIGPTPSAAQTQQAALELLLTDPDYTQAYRAAFAHERAEHVQQLTVPTTLFRWEASPVLPHIDTLINRGLPANVQVISTPASLPARYKLMAERIVKGPQ